MQKWAQKQTGFTIVELLIVVVVIAILAAITIVAYNGIQNRAQDASVQSAVSQAAKKVAAHAIANADAYPSGLNATSITDTDTTRYLYAFSNTGTPSRYCVSATSVRTPTLSYAVTNNSGGPIQGRCITNFVANPGADGASTAYFGAAGSTHATASRTIANDRAHNGATSYRGAVTGTGQLSLMARPIPSTVIVEAGEYMSWSYWVYTTKAGSAVNILEGYRVSDGTYTNTSQGITLPANTWTRISRTWQAPEAIRLHQVGFHNLQVVNGDTVWFDEITLHKSEVLLEYGDGSSANWAWEGSVNAGPSFGPAEID